MRRISFSYEWPRTDEPTGAFSVSIWALSESLLARGFSDDLVDGHRQDKQDPLTIRQISVSNIAGEHGLTPAVAPALCDRLYAYAAQTAESDLNFLSRLAAGLDATAKPASGRLVVVERGTERDADGEEIPMVRLGRIDLADWSWKVTGRGRYGAGRMGRAWHGRDPHRDRRQ